MVTDSLLTNGFVIPNLNVDITQTTIDIVNTNNVITSYSLFTDIVDLKPTDNVFFYHENADGRIVVNFGDGILGSKPELGSVAIINIWFVLVVLQMILMYSIRP